MGRLANTGGRTVLIVLISVFGGDRGAVFHEVDGREGASAELSFDGVGTVATVECEHGWEGEGGGCFVKTCSAAAGLEQRADVLLDLCGSAGRDVEVLVVAVEG